MKLKLPAIDGYKFSKTFIVLAGKRKIADYLDKIGKDRIKWLVKSKRNLVDFVPADMLAEYKEQAKKYDWVGQAITDDDFMRLLPDWVKITVNEQGEEGLIWLKSQVKWMRETFMGG